MKKTRFLLLSAIFSTSLFAHTDCLLVKENQKILIEEGNCQIRYTPQSTFKIALSLMGFDAGILKNAREPKWSLKEGADPYVNTCKAPHNPRTWLRDSCLWYSQVLTEKLGMDKFKNYVARLNYGNQDLSGNKGQNNGLTHAWVSSSLEISPGEQVAFLEKLIKKQLPLTKKAQLMTKKLLFREELPGGWMLYGKTGNGLQWSNDRSRQLELQHGWFVGWIEKKGQVITFAIHISDDKKEDIYASFRAKDRVRNRLWTIIENQEK